MPRGMGKGGMHGCSSHRAAPRGPRPPGQHTHCVVDPPLLVQEQLVLAAVIVQALQTGRYRAYTDPSVRGPPGAGGGLGGDKVPGVCMGQEQREEAHLVLEGQQLLAVRDLPGERVGGIRLLQKEDNQHIPE